MRFSAAASERYLHRNLAQFARGIDHSIVMHCGIIGSASAENHGLGLHELLRDEYTTLPETDDRIFATTIAADWICFDSTGEYFNLTADWSAYRQQIRAAILDVFANQYSKSVQHTLYEMASSCFRGLPVDR